MNTLEEHEYEFLGELMRLKKKYLYQCTVDFKHKNYFFTKTRKVNAQHLKFLKYLFF